MTAQKLAEVRHEYGRTSGEYVRALNLYREQLKADGELDASGHIRNPRPEQSAVVPPTKAELDRRINIAIDQGDYETLRRLALQKVALQLTAKDPKVVRDAAGKILNEIDLDEDDEIRLVEYVTPAAPGWAEMPPSDFYLPDLDATEVTTSAD